MKNDQIFLKALLIRQHLLVFVEKENVIRIVMTALIQVQDQIVFKIEQRYISLSMFMLPLSF